MTWQRGFCVRFSSGRLMTRPTKYPYAYTDPMVHGKKVSPKTQHFNATSNTLYTFPFAMRCTLPYLTTLSIAMLPAFLAQAQPGAGTGTRFHLAYMANYAGIRYKR